MENKESLSNVRQQQQQQDKNRKNECNVNILAQNENNFPSEERENHGHLIRTKSRPYVWF